MKFLDQIDFSNGHLPPWLPPLISLTRPFATTLTAMMLPVGAASVGVVGLFSAERAMNAAAASTAFLQGIPEPLYYLIGIITTGYFGAKTAEVIRAPKPVGGTSPENPDDAPKDTAPRGS